ncbi:hypothetical protein ACIQZO_13630 [Streptomyces sp. NPDC097617]|uniref:hypothetical protein n=1 Tax=Streptomyces sp. NPDC097617 TaxID=3366091 RepID=UPI0038039B72
MDAVVALSTWGNLATSLYDHDTRHLKAVDVLLGLTGGPVERKSDAATQQILADFAANENMDEVVAWGTERAPESRIGGTNRRGVPTFFSNTWHEGLFPVNQVLETFNRLTVPKRLNMWIGDHAVPEGRTDRTAGRSDRPQPPDGRGLCLARPPPAGCGERGAHLDRGQQPGHVHV